MLLLLLLLLLLLPPPPPPPPPAPPPPLPLPPVSLTFVRARGDVDRRPDKEACCLDADPVLPLPGPALSSILERERVRTNMEAGGRPCSSAKVDGGACDEENDDDDDDDDDPPLHSPAPPAPFADRHCRFLLLLQLMLLLLLLPGVV